MNLFVGLHRCSTGFVRRTLLLAVAVVLVAACGDKPAKEPALPPGSMVVALGDSLTAGAGVAREDAWPDLLASRTGWEIVNAGVNGDTSSGALGRLPALLEEYAGAGAGGAGGQRHAAPHPAGTNRRQPG